jgi:hypothetical protein
MNLSIKISRLSNFLFFTQQKGKHLDSKVEVSFYGEDEKNIWNQIKKSTNKQNVKQIKKDLIALKPDFSSHWAKSSKQLFLWKKYFQNNQRLFQQVILEIKKLSGVKNFLVSKIPIYLISNSSNKYKEIEAWFSWTPKESFIVVEIPSDIKVPDNFFPLSVLAHEFFHLMLRKNKNLFLKIDEIARQNEKLFTKLSEGMPSRLFLEELLISSFIPEGFLSEIIFHTKVVNVAQPKYFLAWRKFVAYKSYQIAKHYTDNQRPIDEKYLRDLVDIIK